MSRMQKVDVTGCRVGAAVPVLVPLTRVHAVSARGKRQLDGVVLSSRCERRDTSATSRWPRSLFFPT